MTTLAMNDDVRLSEIDAQALVARLADDGQLQVLIAMVKAAGSAIAKLSAPGDHIAQASRAAAPVAVRWVEITGERFDEMLGVLPPASYSPRFMGFTAFQVGEASDHRNGRPTFASFKWKNGRYYESADSLTFAEFKAEMGGSAVYDYQE